jgi:hypothetical protein
MTKFRQSATQAGGGDGVLSAPPRGGGYVSCTCLSGARHFRSRQAYDLAYETKHPDDRERAWRRVRKCREPCPEKPAGMSAARVRAHMVDHVVLDLTTQYSSFFPGPG